MERPLEIAFHNIPSSDALEHEIRKHAEKLASRYDRLIGCRVSVEGLHKQHQNGNVYEVHITMSVPGRELSVSREPHRAKERYAHPDAYVSVREAFRAAERQLLDFKNATRADTTGPSAKAVAGQVAQLVVGEDYGFILTNTGTQVYFNRDSVTDGKFEDLRPGDTVHYVEEEGDAGPTATKVRVGALQDPK